MGSLRRVPQELARFVELAMQGGGGEFEAVGPAQGARLDERAPEVGGIGEQAGELGVACDQGVSGPAAGGAVAEAEVERAGAGGADRNQADHHVSAPGIISIGSSLSPRCQFAMSA